MPQKFDVEDLRTFAISVILRLGGDAEEAEILADSLAEGQLRMPIYSNQGFVRLSVYARRIRDGGLRVRAPMAMITDGPTTGVLDGGNGFGQVAAVRAMRRAVAKAQSVGIGCVGVRNSNHFGMAGYHARIAATAGHIGIAVTNASPEIATAGGAEPRIGTNPWSIAAPVDGTEPLVLDVSNSQALGKAAFRGYAARGERLPTGWALDAQGNPTDDPDAALAGIVAPMGGYKGAAIAVMMDVLAGVLPGARFGVQVGSPYVTTEPQGVGHFMMAIQIERFLPLLAFHRRLGALIEALHASRRAPGVDRVFVPGEPELERRAQRMAEGCELLGSVESDLRVLADELSLTFPPARSSSSA